MEEEHKKCEQLVAQNGSLRQQLIDSNRTNEALTNDLQKLTNDWSNLRDELLVKEDEFKEEEQVSSSNRCIVTDYSNVIVGESE